MARAEWTQFLGPLGIGVTEDAIPARPQPELKWKRAIGIGFSSISATGDHVYTLGHAEGKETIWCLNLADGSTAWSHSYPAKLLPNLHEGGPAATPTIFGHSVFTLGKEGKAYCVDRITGEVKWQIDINKRFGLKTPEWGYASSARVRGHQLVLDVGPTLCLDSRNGKTLWQTRTYKAGYGSPTYFEQDGKGYYCVLNNEGLLVLHAEDGKVVDLYPWPTSYATNSTTPIYRDRSLFISTAYNKGCALLDFDGRKLRLRYKNQEMRNHMNTCVPFGEYLVGFDRKSHNRRLVKLRCLDWNTGEITWSQENLGCGSLIRAKDKLIILSDRGELVVADANPQAFNERLRVKILDGKCWSHPALVRGHILARNAAGTLVCYAL
jgi:outer membrane protein assembly factor BamB